MADEESPMVETTEEDFGVFREECERWIEILGLKAWDVYYVHEECEGRYGSCASNLSARNATISLAKQWPRRSYEEREIRRTAFHEVAELLIAPLLALAEYRYTSEAEIESQSHAIIRTLERVLYPKYPE